MQMIKINDGGDQRVPDFEALYGDPTRCGNDLGLTPRLAAIMWWAGVTLLARTSGTDSSNPNWDNAAFDALLSAVGRYEAARALTALCEDLAAGEEPYPRSKAEWLAVRAMLELAERYRDRSSAGAFSDFEKLTSGLPRMAADVDGPDCTAIDRLRSALLEGIDVDDIPNGQDPEW